MKKLLGYGRGWLVAGLLVSTAVSFAQKAPGGTAEKLDLEMYARIRQEGIYHSRVMEYSSALFDDIGPRLTGSPNFQKAGEWTRVQLAKMGCVNAHLESWGDFGMGWRQIGTSALMTAPDTATFLAQATPWSPATAGVVTGDVIAVPSLGSEADLAKWKGKLAGKIVLYGNVPKVDPNDIPKMEHYDAAKLATIYDYPLNGYNGLQEQAVLPNDPSFWEGVFGQLAFREKVGAFFKAEGVVAMVMPGGSGGVLSDDTNSTMGWYVYRPEHKQVVPEAVIASEAFGRMARLLKHDVPVTMSVNIDTEFTGDHEQGTNTIAEIAGTDPRLKDQVVMMGGHLDSWIAGTGATDDGAGAVIAMEAMRILNAVGVKPRRTIRIGLWGGEEQGVFGSTGYVESHYATFNYSTKPEEQMVPLFVRQQVGPPKIKPEQKLLDIYLNADNGTGKFLGIYTEGNAAAGQLFEEWGRPLKDLGFTTISERPTGSTDHVPFDEAGLPGFQFIQDPRDYDSRTHHTNQDVYERLSEPDLIQAAVVMATFAYDAAMRDEMVPRKPLPAVGEEDKPIEGLFPGAVKK